MNDDKRAVYVALNEEQFAKLVAGKIVTAFAFDARGSIETKILLSDIGFERMKAAIREAEG